MKPKLLLEEGIPLRSFDITREFPSVTFIIRLERSLVALGIGTGKELSGEAERKEISHLFLGKHFGNDMELPWECSSIIS